MGKVERPRKIYFKSPDSPQDKVRWERLGYNRACDEMEAWLPDEGELNSIIWEASHYWNNTHGENQHGKQSKKLRKLIYGKEYSPRFRQYITIGLTVVADQKRQAYQHLKMAYNRIENWVR